MKKNIIMSMVVLIILIAGGIFYFQSDMFSVISAPTTVELSDGKYYWLTTLSVNSVNEKITHRYNIGTGTNDVKEQIIGDTRVVPVTGFDVGFTVTKNWCKYSVNLDKFYGVPIYKVIGSFERQVDYKVTNSKTDDVETFSAFDLVPKIIEDDDDKGELVIQAQGSLQGMTDCPTTTDLWVCVNDAGVIRYLDSDTIQSAVPTSCLLYLCDCDTFATQEEWIDDSFPTNFIDITLTDNNNYLTGAMPPNSIGSAVVTVSADQDFFDSVYITTPKSVVPEIDDISIGDQVQNGEGTVKIDISNKEDSEGMVDIKPSSDVLSFSPSHRTMTLKDSLSATFSFGVGNDIGDNKEICFEVCDVGNQFTGSAGCDTECEDFDIVAESTADELEIKRCGDGICTYEIGETFTTCPSDCEQTTNCDYIQGSFFSDDKKACVCKEGFEVKNNICTEIESDFNILSLLLILLGLVGGIITAVYSNLYIGKNISNNAIKYTLNTIMFILGFVVVTILGKILINIFIDTIGILIISGIVGLIVALIIGQFFTLMSPRVKSALMVLTFIIVSIIVYMILKSLQKTLEGGITGLLGL